MLPQRLSKRSLKQLSSLSGLPLEEKLSWGGRTCKGQNILILQNHEKYCKMPTSKQQNPMIYKVPSAYSWYRLALTRGMYVLYTSKGSLFVLRTAYKQSHDPSDG